MKGSIRQRGVNTWELRVYQGHDATTGKKRYASRTVKGSRREAQTELAVLVEKVDHPRRRALDTTLGELFEKWYADASPNWAVNTRSHTRSVIRAHLAPRFGHLAVGKLTTADIDDYYAELRRRGGCHGEPLADGTVARIHGVLHRALNQAVRWEWVWTNPAEHANPPILSQREICSPPRRGVVRLLDATKNDLALHAFFRLAVSTGSRRSQLCALQWNDIDFPHAAVSFSRSLAEAPNGSLVVVPTKTRRRNRAEIDAVTVSALRRHRVAVECRAERGGVTLKDDAFVFANNAAGTHPWKPNWATKQFVRIRDSVGLSGFRLHDLRHFMATEMLAAGVPIPVVSARLAHARASTTLNVYAHAIPGGDREAADKLAAILADA